MCNPRSPATRTMQLWRILHNFLISQMDHFEVKSWEKCVLYPLIEQASIRYLFLGVDYPFKLRKKACWFSDKTMAQSIYFCDDNTRAGIRAVPVYRRVISFEWRASSDTSVSLLFPCLGVWQDPMAMFNTGIPPTHSHTHIPGPHFSTIALATKS